MKNILASLSLSFFIFGCSGATPPSEADIKEDPVKAAEALTKAVCACKDMECVTKLKETGNAIKKALNEKKKAGEDAAKEIDAKIEPLEEKTRGCIKALDDK